MSVKDSQCLRVLKMQVRVDRGVLLLPSRPTTSSRVHLIQLRIKTTLTTYKNDHDPGDISDDSDQQSRNDDRCGPVGSLPVLQLRFRWTRLTL
jgi:hypothetical protein